MALTDDYDEEDVRDPDIDEWPAEAVEMYGEVITVNGERGIFLARDSAYADARRLREDREAGR